MTNPIAIIDVDCTVVDSPKYWLRWLNSMTNRNLTICDIGTSYNVGKHFEEALQPYRVHPMDFWRSPSIYDTMEPIEGSLVGLESLKDLGYDIVFVSHVKGQHAKSKHNFLRRNFGSVMDGFIVTKEKHFVNSGTGKDIIVDDRNEFLNRSRASYKFKFSSVWDQHEELKCNTLHVQSMPEVANWLLSNVGVK